MLSSAFCALPGPKVPRATEFITLMIINLKEERPDTPRVYCNKKWRAGISALYSLFLFFFFARRRLISFHFLLA
jgi:hypothetical protein